jgi:hypothetical protein
MTVLRHLQATEGSGKRSLQASLCRSNMLFHIQFVTCRAQQPQADCSALNLLRSLQALRKAVFNLVDQLAHGLCFFVDLCFGVIRCVS